MDDRTPSQHGSTEEPGGIGRRKFVTGALAAAGAATVAGAINPSQTASAAAARRTPVRRLAAGRRVAVFGGGMGGLTVAHELAERGFQVTVYERKAWGGKCRSMPVPGTGSGGRQDLPAEHGFRFFPGFYQNIPDTMKRIPLAGGGTAYDNFVAGTEVVAFYNGIKIPIPAHGSIIGTLSPESLLQFLRTVVSVVTFVPATEAAFFLQKMIAFVASGPQRRLKQWEHMSFYDFVRAEGRSKGYQEFLVEMFTGTLVAAKPDKANAHTMGLMAEAWVYSTLGLGGYGAPDRLLNAPTNEALIDPWMAHLRSLGVQFVSDATLTRLSVAGGQISGAQVSGGGGTTAVEADHYVLAVPVERAVPLLNDDILAIDPSLTSLRDLAVDWMNGLMIYLRRPIDLAEGHVAYAAQPWALTSISQAQFWKKKFGTTYGNGEVNDCLSVDISAWDQPGVLYGKPARDCTREQIFKEVVEQLRRALPWGRLTLTDANIHSYFLDPAITGNGTPQVANDEPLLINKPSSWYLRPEAATRVPNLYLASDYVKADINLATMEGANEAGRKAANAILDASGVGGTPAKLEKLWKPDVFAPIYQRDDARFAAGQPNAFDLWEPHIP
ncbi:NAD-binding domain and a Fe-S cluster-containing protein [Thermomonospora echinospora]|uniref:NAD-binding domain and a Fe-S cluster-containing protein n=1 Tax=Thermomonospora echinospora TaxID=1992 RepID=A0A1H5X9P6_9ACTN|nr:FAD-dependent oxidoreductase [Thermomonospora echinospora]SEG08481.1 NAD-binding domain and a Fe-S cluster-containing protein [Thermomonospora echinospora]